jgi:LemA protein
MKRGGLVAVAVIAVLLIGVGGCLVGNYNKLVTTRENVTKAWSDVDNQLQRRNDLLANLMNTVKGTAVQEQEVFGQIANARAAMAGAKTTAEQIAADQATTSALGRLLVVVENYPQLRSNEAFVQLMDEIAGTENRLAVARQRYNDQARDYNVLVKRFPTNLFASMFNFKEAAYYPIQPGAAAVPKIDFEGLRRPATP